MLLDMPIDVYFDEHRLSVLETLYAKLNRLLSGNDKLITTYGFLDDASGSCDIKNSIITININIASDKSKTVREFLSEFRGINFHELAHYLYALDNLNLKKTLENDVVQLCQFLNDVRDETLFSMTYPKAKAYFRYIAMQYYGKQLKEMFSGKAGDKWKRYGFILLYGRYNYLNKKIIDKAEKMFIEIYGKDVAEKYKKLVKEYMVSKNAENSVDIAIKIKELFTDECNMSYETIQEIAKEGHFGQDAKTSDGKPFNKGGKKTKTEIENDRKLGEQAVKEIEKRERGIQEDEKKLGKIIIVKRI